MPRFSRNQWDTVKLKLCIVEAFRMTSIDYQATNRIELELSRGD
jgi:hypothetical protein